VPHEVQEQPLTNLEATVSVEPDTAPARWTSGWSARSTGQREDIHREVKIHWKPSNQSRHLLLARIAESTLTRITGVSPKPKLVCHNAGRRFHATESRKKFNRASFV